MTVDSLQFTVYNEKYKWCLEKDKLMAEKRSRRVVEEMLTIKSIILSAKNTNQSILAACWKAVERFRPIKNTILSDKNTNQRIVEAYWRDVERFWTIKNTINSVVNANDGLQSGVLVG